MSTTLNLAVLQLPIRFSKIADNISTMQSMLAQHMAEHPDTEAILLPELWTTGLYPQPLSDYADSDGQSIKKLYSKLAQKHHIYIIGGSVITKTNDKYYNTSYAFAPDGKLLTTYNKTHLFSYAGEDQYFTPGDSLTTFTIKGIKCGIIICYDLRFPELARKLALENIDLLFLPAAWPQKRLMHWDTLLRARAIENQIYVAACNGITRYREDGNQLGGHSVILDPWGQELAKASDKDATSDKPSGQIITAQLDTSTLTSIRSTINVFQDRRPHLY